LTSFRASTTQLNERRFFFFNRHGDLFVADGALKPSPIAPASKASVYRRTAFRALDIGVAIIVRFLLGNVLTLCHQ
jgi:hypothetical protein